MATAAEAPSRSEQIVYSKVEPGGSSCVELALAVASVVGGAAFGAGLALFPIGSDYFLATVVSGATLTVLSTAFLTCCVARDGAVQRLARDRASSLVEETFPAAAAGALPVHLAGHVQGAGSDVEAGRADKADDAAASVQAAGAALAEEAVREVETDSAATAAAATPAHRADREVETDKADATAGATPAHSAGSEVEAGRADTAEAGAGATPAHRADREVGMDSADTAAGATPAHSAGSEVEAGRADTAEAGAGATPAHRDAGVASDGAGSAGGAEAVVDSPKADEGSKARRVRRRGDTATLRGTPKQELKSAGSAEAAGRGFSKFDFEGLVNHCDSLYDQFGKGAVKKFKGEIQPTDPRIARYGAIHMKLFTRLAERLRAHGNTTGNNSGQACWSHLEVVEAATDFMVVSYVISRLTLQEIGKAEMGQVVESMLFDRKYYSSNTVWYVSSVYRYLRMAILVPREGALSVKFPKTTPEEHIAKFYVEGDQGPPLWRGLYNQFCTYARRKFEAKDGGYESLPEAFRAHIGGDVPGQSFVKWIELPARNGE